MSISGKKYQETAAKLAAIAPRMREEFCFNTREKWFIDADGEAVKAETITADKPIFNPSRAEAVKDEPEPEPWPLLTKKQLQEYSAEEWAEMRANIARMGEREKNGAEILAELLGPTEGQQKENKRRAATRARRKVADYVRAEYDFLYFITLTLNGEDFPRNDVKEATKRLNNFLRNRVQRAGLKYVVVPEYHHDGENLHFHGLINGALRLEDSGTVLIPHHPRPVKQATAKRYGVPPEEWRTVYNLPEWGYGFTTAIEIKGDRAAVAAYLAKYITKMYHEWDGDTTKIGGRYYWHSHNLRGPVFRYDNRPFDAAEGEEYNNPGCTMRIKYEDGKEA
jgi:hypothetical protein